MKTLPKNDKVVSISQAAEILGVSIDTIRRWDKDGTLHSTRDKNNVRFFSVEELENIKFAKPLSISDAASHLGISQSTLRRLEKKGVITPSRNDSGERVYSKEDLEKFLASEYFLRQKEVEEKILEPLNHEPGEETAKPASANEADIADQAVIGTVVTEHHQEIKKLLDFKKMFYAAGLFVLTAFILIVTVLTILFLLFPQDTAKFFGVGRSRILAQQSTKGLVLGAKYPTEVLGAKTEVSTLGKALKPFGNVALGIVGQVSPETYNKIVPKKPIEDINDIFTIDENNNISTYYNLTMPDTSYLVIPDKGIIKNLNAEYVQGRVPGVAEGNLAVYGKDGTIQGLRVAKANISGFSVGSSDIADGSITSLDLSDGSVTSSELLDGTIVTVDLADNSVTTAKLADSAVTTGKIADGTITNADISDQAAISDSKLAQITAGDKVAGSAVQLNSTGGLVNASGLSLTRTCSNGQVLSWNGSAWACADQSSGTGDITSVIAGDGLTGGATSGDATLNIGAGTGITVTSDTISATLGTSVDLTSEVNGVLPVANGGTNAATIGANGSIAYSTGTAYAFSSIGTSGQCLVSGGAGTPTWGTCGSGGSGVTSLNSLTGALNIAGGGINTVSAVGSTVTVTATEADTLASVTGRGATTTTAVALNGGLTSSSPTPITLSTFTANGGVMYTNGSGVVAQTTVGSSGQCLQSVGGGTPTWGTCGGGGSGDITAVGDVASGDAFNGTQGNVLQFEGSTADDFETTLTSANATADNTITLPNASGTVAVSATGPIALSSLGDITCTTCLTSTTGGTFFINLAGTSGTQQTINAGDTINIAAGAGITTTAGATDTVTIAATLGASVDLTSEVTGVLPIANGGTNGSATPTAGAIAYGTGTAYGFSAAGTTGQCLQSGGTGSPTWAACGGAGDISSVGDVTSGAAFDGTAGNALQFEGATADEFETTLTSANATADNTIILPNASGTVAVSASGPIALDSAGNITCATCSVTGGTLFTAAGSSGTNQTISQGDTLTIAAGAGITTTGSATDVITIVSTLGTSVDLTSEVTGLLPVGNGGTGVGSMTTNGVLYGGSTVGVTAAGTSGQILQANGSGVPTFVTVSADATLAAGGALTLATVNANVGTFGSSTQIPQVTVDGKGRITGVTNVTISGTTPGGTAGGDLSGTYPNPTVVRINGATLGTTTATAGNILIGSGTQWQTQTLSGDATLSSVGVLTLENTGTAGTYGSASQTPVFTTDAQGRVTTVTNTAIAIDASAVTSGTLPIARGGTNSTATPTAGGIAYGTGTAYAFTTAGTTGQCLTSAGAGTPTWGACGGAGDISSVGDVTSGAAFDGTQGNALQFEGSSADDFETTLTSVNATADNTITLPNASGTVAVSASGPIALDAAGDISCPTCLASGGSLFSSAGDSGTSTVAQGQTLTIAGGTNGIDTVDNASRTVTLNLDTTEMGTTTFGADSDFAWTFDPAGATNPTIAFTNNLITLGGPVVANSFSSSGATITGGTINGTSIGASTPSSGAFTTLSATGDVSFNDLTADTILIGQSGATDDTVTIAGDLSLTDDQWSISSTGVATGLSGTNTGFTAGDLSCTNCIGTAEVAGIDISDDTNLSASDGIALTGDALTNTDKGSSQNIFKTIAVAGQSNVVSDLNSDTLTFAAGSNVTLTTDAATDTVTINATDTNTTYSAGDDLDLTGTTFSLETTLDFVDTINLAGTGTLNGLDAIDATTETTLEGALDIAGDVTGTGLGAVTLSSNVVDDNELVDALTYTGVLSLTGNFNANDASADTILIGQSGATDDTVTIAGDLSLTDDQWSISSTGVTTGLSGTNTGFIAGDLSCTNCIGATEIDESTIASTSLSDGAFIAHTNVAETITGGWTFDTAATTFTTGIIANGGITSAAGTALNIDSGTTGALNLGTGNDAKAINIGTGTAGDTISIGTNNTTKDTINIGSALDDVAITGDQWSITNAGVLTVASCTGCSAGGSTLQSAYEAGSSITTTDADGDLLFTLANTTTDASFNIDMQADNSVVISRENNGIGEAPAQLLLLQNLDGDLLIADGLLIGAAAGGLTDGVDASDPEIDNAINIGGNAIAGTNFSVTDAGVITSTGLNAGSGTITTTGTIGTAGTTTFTGGTGTFSGAIAANGGITFDQATDTLGAHTLAGTLDAGTNILTNIGNAGTDFIAGTGALTLAGILTANDGALITGATDINTTGTAATTIGNTAGGTITIGAASGSNLILQDANWNISGAGAANFPSIGTVTPGTGAFTTLSATGDVSFNDLTADTILIGQSGATDDTVTIAGDLSLTDDQWSISSTGVATGLSGTNTGFTAGDLSCTNCIGTAEVAGIDISDDTNLSASDGIALTGDALTNTDKGSSQNIFKTIAVAGQSNVVSDLNSDTLTFAAGSNVTLTTDAATDTVTINATDTNTTYSAGDDLDLTGTTFSLETTLDFVDTINLAGTGTLNGLDAIDATTETTLEGALDIAGDVTGTGLGAVTLSSNVVDDNELVDALTYTGVLSLTGNFNANDASADTILIGQSGATDDTVTIAGDLSLTDDQWSISSTGVTTGLSGTNTGFIAGDLSCTNCIGATEIDESTIASTSLSDGAFIAHTNVAETITGGWTFDTAATTFTTGIDSNGDLSIADTNIAFDGASTTFSVTGALVINGTSTDIQDAVNVDSLTTDVGGVSIAAGQSYTGAGAVTLSSAAGTALTVDSGTTGAVNLATGNNAKTISIGTGTAGNLINIGTDNTTKDTINIGSALDDVAITGDQWSITNAGVLTVASCSGCGGGATLDSAYTAGNTIGTDSGSNIIFNLAEVATPTELTINNLDTAGTNAVQIDNNISSGTLANGLLIEQSGAGNMTSAIQIAETAGAIADGILITGTLGNILNSASIDITGTGAITGATGVSTTTLTATGDVTMNDASADNILIGQSGATDDVVTIAGDLSLTDDQWSITSAGAATGLSGTNTGFIAGDLSCTDCIGATEINESTISSTNLSDGANIAHINVAETITGGWTFNTAATTFTTAINANGGLTTTTTDQNLAFSTNGAGDFIFSVDSGTNLQLTGGADGTNALNVAAGDVSVTDGDFSVTAGDFNVGLDTGDTANITKTGASAGDVLSIVSSSVNAIDGVDVALTSTADAGADNVNGLNLSWTESTDADVYTALNLANTTSTNSTTQGLVIGTGYDVGIDINSGGLSIDGGNLTSSQATLTINAGGNVDIQDAVNVDSLTTDVGGVSIAAGQSYTGAGAVTLSSAAGTALTVDSGTTGAVNLATGNNAKTISIGTGTAGNLINIGTDNTTKDTINIGSALDDVAITGDQWSITDAGVLTVQSCTGCGGGATLDSAYTAGNTIGTDSGSNIIFNLAEVGTPTEFTINNLDTAATNAVQIDNSIASGTLANGLLIEQSAAGTMTNAIQIAETAGTITDGILITGTLGNILNSASIDITGAGAITGATGVSTTTLTATGDVTMNDASADSILIGQAGATDDIVTIAGDLSLTDDQWSITSAGLLTSSGGLNITAGDIALTDNVGGTWSITAGGVITAATDESINGIDISAGAVSDVTDLALVLAAAGDMTVSAVASTVTTGIVNLDVDTAVTGGFSVVNNSLTVNSGAATGDDYFAEDIRLTNNDTDANAFGMRIIGAATANAGAAAYEAGLIIDNQENTAGSMSSAIQILATTDTATTVALDVDDAEIVTALSVGANDIIGTTGLINYTGFDIDASGNLDALGTLTAGSSNIAVTDATGHVQHDSIVDCADTQILKWSTGGGEWGCAADNAGGTVTLDQAYTSGNTIGTDSGSNIIFNLAEVGTPTEFTINNLDTAATNAVQIDNSIASGTLANGLLIEQSAAGTMTNAIQIAETAGTITDGILITGTLGNILNSASIDITGAGAITGATGVTTTTLDVTGNITANDSTADTILIGQSGATDDIVTIAGDLSLTDDQWSITSAGLLTSSGGLNITAGDIALTDNVGGTWSITAGGVITANTDESINGIDINAGAVSDITDFAAVLGASGDMTVSAVASTVTSGVINIDVDSAVTGGFSAINNSLTVNNGAATGDDYFAADFTLTNNDANANAFGLRILGAATANAGADAYQGIVIDNQENTAGSMSSAIQILATTDTATTVALDVDDAEIVTALSAGANDLTGTSWGIAGATGIGTFAGGVFNGNVDMTNDLILNIGDGNTDFTSGGGLNIAGLLDVNGNLAVADTDIAFDGASTTFTVTGALTINGTSTDIQDAVTVDSLTADTGGVSIAAGQSYTGAGAVTLSSGGSSGLTLDSASGTVALATGDVLQISRAGNPTAANGMIFYDSTAGKYKIVEDVAGTPTVKILCNTTDAGCGAGGTSTLQSAYDATSGNTILTDASGDIIFQTIGGATDTQFEVNAASAPEIDMINFTNSGQGVTATSGVDLLSLNYVQAANATAITGSGLDISLTPSGDSTDVIRGITLNNVTAGSSTETGLYIGTGYDQGVEFADGTPTIRLGATDNTASFSIKDSAATPNELVLLRDLSTNFGATLEAGAMISRNSYIGDEFTHDFVDLIVDTAATTLAPGDLATWGVEETATTGDCVFSNIDDSVNGIFRLLNSDAAIAGACNAYYGDRATISNLQLIFDADNNLPVMIAKVKPSNVGALDKIWVGMQDQTNLATDTLPTNGIFFTNDGGSNWNGVVRSGGTSAASVNCGVAINTAQYALLKFEVVSASLVRFYVDANVADGISWTSCGSATTNIPTTPMSSMLKMASATLSRSLDVDFYRVWQDDNGDAPTENSESSESPLAIESAPSEFDGRSMLADLMVASENMQYDPGQKLDIQVLAASKGIVTPELTANKIATNIIESTSGDGLDVKLVDGEAINFTDKNDQKVASIDDKGNAFFAGTITADKIKANQIEGLEVITDTVTSLSQQMENLATASDAAAAGSTQPESANALDLVKMARSSDPELLGRLNDQVSVMGTSSAQTTVDIDDLKQKVASLSADLNLLKLASASAGFDELLSDETATVSGLMVTGRTTLNDLSVTGTQTNGLITIDGLTASIDSLDALKIQPSAAADIEFLAGAITFDKEGNIHLKKGRIIANDNVRGIDVEAPEGESEIAISFADQRPSNKYAINVTPSWFTQVLVTQKTTDGFKVKFSEPAPVGASIDWVAID